MDVLGRVVVHSREPHYPILQDAHARMQARTRARIHNYTRTRTLGIMHVRCSASAETD